MPNVTAFQKADRLALLIAIDSFFALLGELPTCEEATKLAFTIRRCEYQGNPADVKNLMHLLGWSKTKVLTRLKEVQEFFEFRTVKDPLDNRRSVQVLHGIESPATTEFFEKCLKVVDDLVEARAAAKKLRPEPDQEAKASVPSPLAAVVSKVTRATRLLPLAAAGWLAAWLVFDTDKVDDINRWSNEAFDHSIWELIEDPVEHFWNHADPEHPHELHDRRARDTTVRFAMAEPIDFLDGRAPLGRGGR